MSKTIPPDEGKSKKATKTSTAAAARAAGAKPGKTKKPPAEAAAKPPARVTAKGASDGAAKPRVKSPAKSATAAAAKPPARAPTRKDRPHSVATVEPDPELERLPDQPFEESPRAEIDPELRQRLISDAAYRRYAARGFTDGYDVEDWLEAEAEVDHLLLDRKAG